MRCLLSKEGKLISPAKLFALPVLVFFFQFSFAQTWSNVGNKAFSDSAAWFPAISAFTNYGVMVAYQDEKSEDWLSVSSFLETHWQSLGITGFSGREVTNVSLVPNQSGRPYVAFSDKYYRGQASVMKYNDSTWEYVGADRFSTSSANFLSLAISPSGVPYVAYAENDSVLSLKVMKYDEADSVWKSVGNTSFANKNVFNCSVQFDHAGNLYVAYTDASNDFRATVRKWTGSNWDIVGSGAFSPALSNFLKLTFSPQNVPFVAFASGNDNKATVMKFNGSAWENIGDPAFTPEEAYQLSLVAGVNNIPAISYTNSKFQPNVFSYVNDKWISNNKGLFTDGVAFNTSFALDEKGFFYFAYVDNANLGGTSVMRSGNALPVKLLSFTGKAVQNTAELNWTTSMEQNNDHFDVQRSVDGVQFRVIGKVNSKGNSLDKQEYRFTDFNPVIGATNYYRLSQVDRDGRAALTQIVPLQFGSENSRISLFPNPAKDWVNLKLSNVVQGVTVSIFSANGQLQFTKKYDTPEANIPLSISKLASGTYHVVVTKANGEKQTLTFIKE